MARRSAFNGSLKRKKTLWKFFLARRLKSDRLVSISVKNGKVYVGHLISSFDPVYGVQSLTLLRSYSGHRDKETLAFHLDIDYEQVLEETFEKSVTATRRRIREENPGLSEDEIEERTKDESEEWNRQGEEVDRLTALEIVIPVSEIQSVNIFDESIYTAVSREEGGEE